MSVPTAFLLTWTFDSCLALPMVIKSHLGNMDVHLHGAVRWMVPPVGNCLLISCGNVWQILECNRNMLSAISIHRRNQTKALMTCQKQCSRESSDCGCMIAELKYCALTILTLPLTKCFPNQHYIFFILYKFPSEKHKVAEQVYGYIDYVVILITSKVTMTHQITGVPLMVGILH